MENQIEIDEPRNIIRYYQNQHLMSEFKLEDILVIGELVIDKGPIEAGHYLTFISKNKFWHSIDVRSEGYDKMLNFISPFFNLVSFIQYANVKSFNSRIIYPKEYIGKQFVTLQVNEPVDWFDRIKMKIGMQEKWKYIATNSVTEALKIDSHNIQNGK